jgi:hypothetical protein
MCVITEGITAQLLKGGLVRLNDGSVYRLDDCKLEAGGRIVLAVGIEREKPRPKPRPNPRPKIVGEVNLEGVEVSLGDFSLETQEIILHPPKEPPPPFEPPATLVPFTLVGAALLYLLKKVSGLDRKLKHGSCEVRHQEAITRIAKLEGKVLRKQVVDGGKAVKAKLDERKANKGNDGESK